METDQYFDVEIRRTAYGEAVVGIPAATQEEATEKALAVARDHSFSSREADYEIVGCTPRQSFNTLPGDVVFMTSFAGDATEYINASRLAGAGLPFGSRGGEFYPLTDREQEIVSEGRVHLFGHFASMGYTALVGDRKFMAPDVEIPFDSAAERQSAAETNRNLGALFSEIATRVGGYLKWSAHPQLVRAHGGGRFYCTLLIPMEYALRYASTAAEWRAHFEGLLVASDHFH